MTKNVKEPARVTWPGDPEDVNETRRVQEQADHDAVIKRRDEANQPPEKAKE
jgi:hypothetical protein